MKILGIDIGTRCGWALWSDGLITASGVWELKPSRFEGPGMKAIKLQRCMSEVLAGGGVKLVCAEEVRRHMGVDAAHCYGGLLMAIQSHCEAAETPFTTIPVGTLKHRATGRGNADKDAMIAAAESLLKRHVADDNEADAIWVAVCGAEIYSTLKAKPPNK